MHEHEHEHVCVNENENEYENVHACPPKSAEGGRRRVHEMGISENDEIYSVIINLPKRDASWLESR